MSGIHPASSDSAVERLTEVFGEQSRFRTRRAAEAIGWRITCHCYTHPGSTRPDVWVSNRLWIRVPSRSLESLADGKIYAADEDVDKIDFRTDVSEALLAQWHREHIDGAGALAAISTAPAAIGAAEQRLAEAVSTARKLGLSWAKIGAAAGTSAQAAHDRWAAKTRL